MQSNGCGHGACDNVDRKITMGTNEQTDDQTKILVKQVAERKRFNQKTILNVTPDCMLGLLPIEWLERFHGNDECCIQSPHTKAHRTEVD